MNPRYKFSWCRRFWWWSMYVTGHKYEKDQDKMVLFLVNGGIREIKNWNNCECRLGDDWVNITKEDIKEEAGV